MSPDERLEFGTRLRFLRRAANLTQKELARRVGISRRDISAIERGRVQDPRSFIADIARVLEVDPEWLDTGAGPAPLADQPHRLTGAEIRRVREKLGMSIDTLATYIGLTARTLIQAEQGHNLLGARCTRAILEVEATGQPVKRPKAGPQQTATRQSGPDDDALLKIVALTYEICRDSDAMAAVEQLSESLGDTQVGIISKLVKSKIDAGG